MSIRQWAYNTFGDERAIQFVVMATPEFLAANAEFIRRADEFVEVPGGSNANNYANVQLIVDLCISQNVDAVMVGWGYASEARSSATSSLRARPSSARIVHRPHQPGARLRRRPPNPPPSAAQPSARRSPLTRPPSLFPAQVRVLDDKVGSTLSRRRRASPRPVECGGDDRGPAAGRRDPLRPVRCRVHPHRAGHPPPPPPPPPLPPTPPPPPPPPLLSPPPPPRPLLPLALAEAVDAAELGYPVMLKASEAAARASARLNERSFALPAGTPPRLGSPPPVPRPPHRRPSPRRAAPRPPPRTRTHAPRLPSSQVLNEVPPARLPCPALRGRSSPRGAGRRRRQGLGDPRRS